jgi:hemolysin III
VRNSFVAKAIYGLITVQAVLLEISDHPPEAWNAAITLFGTTLVVALVENYAEIIARTIGAERRLTRTELCDIWEHVRPVLVGAQAPTLVMILAAFGVFTVEQAINVSEVIVFLLLFGFGLRVGQLLHQSRVHQVLSGLGLVLISGFLVLLKALLH